MIRVTLPKARRAALRNLLAASHFIGRFLQFEIRTQLPLLLGISLPTDLPPFSSNSRLWPATSSSHGFQHLFPLGFLNRKLLAALLYQSVIPKLPVLIWSVFPFSTYVPSCFQTMPTTQDGWPRCCIERKVVGGPLSVLANLAIVRRFVKKRPQYEHPYTVSGPMVGIRLSNVKSVKGLVPKRRQHA